MKEKRLQSYCIHAKFHVYNHFVHMWELFLYLYLLPSEVGPEVGLRVRLEVELEAGTEASTWG